MKALQVPGCFGSEQTTTQDWKIFAYLLFELFQIFVSCWQLRGTGSYTPFL